jgi:hypothetical protein
MSTNQQRYSTELALEGRHSEYTSTPVVSQSENGDERGNLEDFGLPTSLDFESAEDEEMNRAILMSLQAVQPSNADQGFGAMPEPDKASVDAILAMGFSREDAVGALKASNYDVEAAIIRILNSG